MTRIILCLAFITSINCVKAQYISKGKNTWLYSFQKTSKYSIKVSAWSLNEEIYYVENGYWKYVGHISFVDGITPGAEAYMNVVKSLYFAPGYRVGTKKESDDKINELELKETQYKAD